MLNMSHIRRGIPLSCSCLFTQLQRIYQSRKNITAKQIPKLVGIFSETPTLENRRRTNYSNNSRGQDLAPINYNNPRYFFSSISPHPQWPDPVFSGFSNLHLRPSSWVSRVLEILLNSDSNFNLETALEELCAENSLRLSPQFITHVLRTPKVQKSPKIAFRFFNWTGKQQGFEHELSSYVAVIESLGAVKDVDSIRAVASALKAKISENPANVEYRRNSANLENHENGELPKSKLKLYACNILMKNFGRTGMVEEAWDIWHALKENGIQPEIFTYNCLIDALVNGNCVDRAERILEMMIEEARVGVRDGPDVVSYNMIIKGVCKAGRVEAAMDYLRQMEVNHCLPDQITYLTIMQAFHAEGRFDQTLSLFQEIPDRKLAIPSHAYNLVICGLCNEGRPYEGNKLLGDILRKECKPNLVIYTTLVDSFFKVGDKENALKLLEQVQERGYKLDKFTCSTVVNGLCKVGEVEQAWDFLERSQVLGLDVNAFSYSAIIDGLSKAGKIEEAEKVFKAMSERGCAGDVFCFNAIIDGLCKAAEIQKAMRILRRMEKEGCEPTVYTYTILIDGHFKVRNSEAALKLWDEMIDRGISPTAVSFRTLSTGLCLSGNVTRACRILDELATMGVVPDTAYADMIKVLCKAGRVKQACKLADGIIDRGREVPGKLRCAFINALRKAGKADLAFKMVHSRIGIGYSRSGRIKRRIKFRTLVEPDK